MDALVAAMAEARDVADARQRAARLLHAFQQAVIGATAGGQVTRTPDHHLSHSLTNSSVREAPPSQPACLVAAMCLVSICWIRSVSVLHDQLLTSHVVWCRPGSRLRGSRWLTCNATTASSSAPSPSRTRGCRRAPVPLSRSTFGHTVVHSVEHAPALVQESRSPR